MERNGCPSKTCRALSGTLLRLISGMSTSPSYFMGTLHIAAETVLQVVGVDNGEVLLEPEHHGVLARIVLVILDGGDSCYTCVDDESLKYSRKNKKNMH